MEMRKIILILWVIIAYVSYAFTELGEVGNLIHGSLSEKCSKERKLNNYKVKVC